MTQYYVDFDNGDDADDGLAAVAGGAGVGPWATLDQFTENARAAGDICTVRRGMTQVVTSDLTATSDGDPSLPIVLEADYDDVWGDFANSARSYTLAFGSKTVTGDGAVADVVANDWIFVVGEDSRLYAYEVESVVAAVITLYLPYKGEQAGAGRTLTVMPYNPRWNTAAGNFGFVWNSDHWWLIQGIWGRGTDPNGVVYVSSCIGVVHRDCIAEGNGGGDRGFNHSGDSGLCFVVKSRSYNGGDYSFGGNKVTINDCLADGASVAGSVGIRATNHNAQKGVFETELKNHDTADFDFDTPALVTSRNVIMSSALPINNSGGFNGAGVKAMDFQGTIGDNRQITWMADADGTPIIQSELATLYGTDVVGIRVTPSLLIGYQTGVGGTPLDFFEPSLVTILEYPVYLTAAAHIFTAYFNLPAANFTAAPVASEMWLEVEYWSTNGHRRVFKSTGVVLADGTWDSITVACTPASAGIAFFRIIYNKRKEAGDSNIFYVRQIVTVT